MARQAQAQSNQLINTASGDATQAGANAAGNYAAVNPYLTNQLRNPSGESQQDLTAQLSAAEGGAGGATSGLTGAASLMAARTRNASGFSGALDDAARARQQTLAGTSEKIAANNADLKTQQQQQAAQGLAAMYGTNLNAQSKDLGIQSEGIQDALKSGQSGWLQNAMNIAKTVGGVASGLGSMGYKPFGG